MRWGWRLSYLSQQLDFSLYVSNCQGKKTVGSYSWAIIDVLCCHYAGCLLCYIRKDINNSHLPCPQPRFLFGKIRFKLEHLPCSDCCSPLLFPPFVPRLVWGNKAKGNKETGCICRFSAYLCACSRQVISMPCTWLPLPFPRVAPLFILSSSVKKKKKTFLLFFSHRGWLAERAQQQPSDLLIPSISYPEM